MTSKQNKLSTPTKPAPVELRDEALDRVAGGGDLTTTQPDEYYKPIIIRKNIDKSTPT